MDPKVIKSLQSACSLLINSQDPYINATLKRLAKAAYDRIEKRKISDNAAKSAPVKALEKDLSPKG